MRQNRDAAQRNLYVLNLPLNVSTEQFEELFKQHGQVAHAVILATLDGLARRRGFILMQNSREADVAIKQLDGHSWHGYRMEVSFAIVQRNGAPLPQVSTDSGVDSRRQFLPNAEEPTKRTTESTSVIQDKVTLLLLTDLDTKVISSQEFLCALIRPFGRAKEATMTVDDPFDSKGIAKVRLCCTKSARTAKRTLDGLKVGRFCLTARLLLSDHHEVPVSPLFVRSSFDVPRGQALSPQADMQAAMYQPQRAIGHAREGESSENSVLGQVCDLNDSLGPLKSQALEQALPAYLATNLSSSSINGAIAAPHGLGSLDSLAGSDRPSALRPIGDERWYNRDCTGL